jgi:hypothetical protein
MKKLSFILIATLLLFSCKKDDPPVLTGTWNLYQTFTSGGNTFTWTVSIIQDGNKLSGNVVISDGSGYALLLTSSSTSGNNVTLEWMVSTYKVSCQGSINANYDSMNGSFSSGGTTLGTWLANKKNQ